ncbi:MAG: hypothetical protein A2X12_00205 [Bacteroidetes bacterium GWE2_29_8]|nr:MAG: hypothetical protein A2X12_00205 [Bacteroidetes bacterium GWE2_29_8]OFY15383.1 MAG: hypothetical protein A2X02_03035 [Bacteroidetes bacterium GWF2_29_10]
MTDNIKYPDAESVELLTNKLKQKSIMKQVVYSNTFESFNVFKEIIKNTSKMLASTMSKAKNIKIEYTEKGEFEVHLTFAGDVLIFIMHSNIFEFPRDHEIMKTQYIKEDIARSYCGIINVYNFLSDSFKYNRATDVGYLVARIFINKEKHFYVEGKRQMGILFNNFTSKNIDAESITQIINSAVMYSIDFDLLTPFYDDVKQLSVQEVFDNNNYMKIKTGKRLGFRFQADHDELKNEYNL